MHFIILTHELGVNWDIYLASPPNLWNYIRRTHGRKQLQTTHPLLMLWLCEKYFPHIQQTCLSYMFTISELPFSPAINCPFPKYEPPLLPAVVICPVKRQLVKSRASHPWSSTSVGTLATSALYETCFSRWMLRSNQNSDWCHLKIGKKMTVELQKHQKYRDFSPQIVWLRSESRNPWNDCGATGVPHTH